MFVIFLSVMQLHPVGVCITCAHQNSFGFLDNNIFWVGRKMIQCVTSFSLCTLGLFQPL